MLFIVIQRTICLQKDWSITILPFGWTVDTVMTKLRSAVYLRRMKISVGGDVGTSGSGRKRKTKTASVRLKVHNTHIHKFESGTLSGF